MTDSRGPVLRLFLCGDVMTGRGVDQVLPHPGDPRIHESYARSAQEYVRLAEQANGPFRRPVDFADIWGDALAELDRARPDARIVNLETSVTRSDDYWVDKGINYRMHPANIPSLTAAGIDCCALANNHVLDYGYAGLRETLETLASAGIKTAGAGMSKAEARSPAVIDVADKGRVVVFAFAAESSGVPRSWAATDDRPGIDLLEDLSGRTIERIERMVSSTKRPRDVVVASIHWGDNWGYEVPDEHVRFGHRLIEVGVDVIHGHSSHHPRPIEVFQHRPILYGCGDFLDDYEGISGYEEFRDDLTLMYFADVDADSARLIELTMTPMRVRQFRLNHASPEEVRWLRDTIDRESRAFGLSVDLCEDLRLAVRLPL